MPHNNILRRQMGPLELWQWATVGVGIGGMILILTRHKEGKGGISPEQEEKLLGGLRSAPAGAGGESIPPGLATTTPTPAPGEVGAQGPPGPPGESPTPGATAAEVAQELNPTLASISNRVSSLERHTSAPGKRKAPKAKRAKRKGKPTSAQHKARTHTKAHKQGKSQPAKKRGNHTAQTGKPNHSPAKPIAQRFKPSTRQVQNRQAQQRAQQAHDRAIRQARERHEREKRERERREREERRRREREAREKREREARERANRQRAVAARRK